MGCVQLRRGREAAGCFRSCSGACGVQADSPVSWPQRSPGRGGVQSLSGQWKLALSFVKDHAAPAHLCTSRGWETCRAVQAVYRQVDGVLAVSLTEVLACRAPPEEHWADKSGEPGARLALHLLLRPQDAAECGRCGSVAAAVAPPTTGDRPASGCVLEQAQACICLMGRQHTGAQQAQALPVCGCLHTGAQPATQLALPVHCMQQLASVTTSAAQPRLPTLQPSPLSRTSRTERLFCWDTTSPPV